MKKGNKRNNTKIIVKAQNIEMERKKDVVIKNNVDRLTEEEIKKLIKAIEEENQKMKHLYFAFNTPIINTRKRTFKDLVKKFWGREREHLDLRIEKIVSQNRI